MRRLQRRPSPCKRREELQLVGAVVVGIPGAEVDEALEARAAAQEPLLCADQAGCAPCRRMEDRHARSCRGRRGDHQCQHDRLEETRLITSGNVAVAVVVAAVVVVVVPAQRNYCGALVANAILAVEFTEAHLSSGPEVRRAGGSAGGAAGSRDCRLQAARADPLAGAVPSGSRCRG